MLKFNDIVYSILRSIRANGLEVTDEETQSEGEASLLLTLEGINPKAITFNASVERWEIACTLIARASSKDKCYNLLDQFCEVLHGGLPVPLYTTDGTLVFHANARLTPSGPVMTALPFAWQFSQQFKLELLQEAT